jgi:hypothetical protein
MRKDARLRNDRHWCCSEKTGAESERVHGVIVKRYSVQARRLKLGLRHGSPRKKRPWTPGEEAISF